mgnify:CR=1 FL=1
MSAATLSPRRIGLVGGFLVALGPVSLALYTPALPSVVAALDTTPGAVKLTLTAYFVGLAVAQLVCGPLSDAYGRRPVTLWFVGLYIVATLGCALAPTIDLLIAGRFVQGVGASVGLAIARAIVRDGFTGEPAAKLYNLIGLVLAIGPAVSPTIGALTIAVLDWHAVFLVMAAFGAMVAVFFLVFIPETNAAPDPGVLDPRRMARNWGLLLSTRSFMVPSVICGMAIGGVHASAAFLPFLLIETLGLSPFGFALVMLIQTGAYVGSTVLVRALLYRFDAVRLMGAGVAMIVLGGVILFGWLQVAEPTVVATMAPIAIWMLGIALVMPGATSEAMAPFPRIAGSASAMLGFFQLSGGFLGSAAAALLPDPVTALATVLPTMAAVALAALAFKPKGEPPAMLDAALAPAREPAATDGGGPRP